MRRYKEWAKREYSLRQRVGVLALAFPFFVILIPYLLLAGGRVLDGWLGLAGFAAAPYTHATGALFAVAGFALALWSIAAQVDTGRGTPLPMVPTQELVVHPPFTYCRNPMTLGTILAYGGIGLWIGSWSALAIVAVIGGLLLLYIKLMEEKELEARFGAPYLAYKRRTPFLIPRLRRRG